MKLQQYFFAFVLLLICPISNVAVNHNVFIELSVSSVAAASPCGGDDTWHGFDEKCFKLIDEFVGHDDAQKLCSTQFANGELLKIGSAEEQAFLTNLIFADLQVIDSVWLGAVRSQGNDDPAEFLWNDGSSLLYTNWAVGSPSIDLEKNCTLMTSRLTSSLKQNKAAMLLNTMAEEDGLWTDVSCLKRNLVVCQRSLDWSVGEIQQEISLIWSNLTDLQAGHDVLEISHEVLQRDFDALRVNHDLLQADYNELKAAFNELAGYLRPTSCSKIHNGGDTKATIYPFGLQGRPVTVQCDFETDGGGWTIIQRRRSGPLDQFFLDWSDYVEGFGLVDENYWIGLEAIHAMTTTLGSTQEMRIELEDWEGGHAFAQYKSFSVGNATEFYPIATSGFSGTAGDSLAYQQHAKFSTRDKDNDPIELENCAQKYHGAWWYGDGCGQSNLNGYYFGDGLAPNLDGIHWYHWGGYYVSMKQVEIKIRDAI